MQKPNILLFLPDGMAAHVVDPKSDCRTPNFDRLARRGVRFTRAHAPLPTCSPSRASLMTGLMPHNHGVLQVEHCVDDDQSVLRTNLPHWAQRLSEAGYRTGYFGKWHIERSYRLEDFGWQVNGAEVEAAHRTIGSGDEGTAALLAPGNFARYITDPDGYNPVLHYGVTDMPSEKRRFSATTDNALAFISEAEKGKEPWACCVSFSEPNTPVIAGRNAFAEYDIDSIALPGNLNDMFINSPGIYRREKRIWAGMSERQWRELRAVYYALVTELDEQFGRLLNHLEHSGSLENTLVIVASDHGRYLGAHGFDNHNFGAFEEAYNIPLIVGGPGVAQNVESDALVMLHDLCPTLLELAGAKSIDTSDARSFASVLVNPTAEEEAFHTAYAEFHGTRFVLTQRVLWDGPWKFVFNGFDEDELYNLDDDPHELTNLAGMPDHQERIRISMTRMWQYIKHTRDHALIATHYPPMRLAAIGPNAAKA